MKKKLYMRIAAVFLALILMSCLFCCIVSADADSYNAYRTTIRSNPEAAVSSFAFHSGSSTTSGIGYLDTESFSETSSDLSEYVTAYDGYYDWPYHQFDVDYDFRFPNGPENVFSYAFDYSYVTAVDVEMDRYQLQYVDLVFWSSLNVYVTGVRFSVREYWANRGEIGRLISVSQVYEYPDLQSPSGTANTIEYGLRLDSVKFTKVAGSLPSFPTVVVCIDFIFDSNAERDPHSIGIKSSLEFDFWQLSRQTGPEDIYFPDITIPDFIEPDSFRDEALALQSDALAKFSSGSESLSDLAKSLRNGLPDFAVGFSNIASMLSYGVSTIPFLSFVVTVSLLFGLISFILGLAGSLHSAKEKSSSDREENNLNLGSKDSSGK